MRPIDLDQNATTPLAPEVLEAMRPYWLAGGNPQSRHGLGRTARRALDAARGVVAETLGADPSEVLLTSGGTEANHLALRGLADPGRGPGPIVAGPIEHPAVVGPLDRLERAGFSVERGRVGTDGIVDLESLTSRIGPTTRLATLMLANNETGVMQPVGRLAEAAAVWGVPVHTDAVQAVGRIPVDFRWLGVATLALSAHKFHGPLGIGALLVRRGVPFAPDLWDDAGPTTHVADPLNRDRLRPGTPAVPLAVGMATALNQWRRDREARINRMTRLRDRLEDGLRAALGSDAVVRNGPDDPVRRLPQTVNLAFPGRDGNALLMQLDLAGVAVSLGSACASGANTPSPTLAAMGLPDDRLRASVRFSFGAFTTEAEIDEAVRRIVAVMVRSDTA